MSKFDELIVGWRKEMSAAGIGPGEKRDELESHLRDGFEQRVRAGMTEEAAFTAAAARLGAPGEIRREYDCLGPVRNRDLQLLHAMVFPANLGFCAKAALIAAPYYSFWSTLDFFSHTLRFAQNPIRLIASANSTDIEAAVVMLSGVLGFIGAALWLRRNSIEAARMLIFFWTAVFWHRHRNSLLVLIFQGLDMPFTRPTVWWVMLANSIMAVSVYYAWTRRISEERLAPAFELSS